MIFVACFSVTISKASTFRPKAISCMNHLTLYYIVQTLDTISYRPGFCTLTVNIYGLRCIYTFIYSRKAKSLVRRNQYANKGRKEEKENFMFSVHFKHIIIIYWLCGLQLSYFINYTMSLRRRLYIILARIYDV